MKDFKKIDNLVIRASYGVQGNIDKSTSSYVMGNYMNVSMLPGVTEDLISLGNPPNKRLRWEKTKTMNFGTDIALFNNALNVTVDYYRRKGGGCTFGSGTGRLFQGGIFGWGRSAGNFD